MNSYKKNHLETRIKILLADILLNEIENEKVRNASIIDVKMTPDNSTATVLVTFPAYPEQSITSMRGLGTYIRKRIAANLDTKRCPFFKFELDKTMERQKEIDDLFAKIK